MIKFSIILVCKDAENYIKYSLDSLSSVSDPEHEVIIIDGASSDSTLEIINENKTVFMKVISEPDSGLYDAMNKGIRHSNGHVLLFMGADDQFIVNSLESVRECFEINEDVEIVYGDLIYINSAQKEISRLTVTPNQFPLTMIPHPATFFKKEVFEKIGFFDESLSVSADYEFLARCFVSRIKMKYIESVIMASLPFGFSDKHKYSCLVQDFKIRKKFKLASLFKIFMIFISGLVFSIIRDLKKFTKK